MSYPKAKSESYEMTGGINSKVSPYDNGPTEFRDLTNVNFMKPGALTKRPGSADYAGATITGRITGAVEFNRLSGASYLVATANTNAYTFSQGGYSAFKSGLANGALFDFVTFVDRLFCANGTDFFKFDGVNSQPFSLPPPIVGYSVTAGTGALTGTFQFGYAYVNDRGYVGPVTPIGASIALSGQGAVFAGITAPANFGISYIQFYRSLAGLNELYGTTFLPIGTTTFTDAGIPLGTIPANNNLYFTLAPKFMELYNNQLFLAGFSALPSTVYWSEIGEPESINPDYFAEFRTNDGDTVTALRAYSGSLIAAKRRSFHRIVGDNPTNFTIQEISDQYGCLSHRTMIQWENFLWFLDEKGIVEYNGANISIVSIKIEPIFQRMNITAAIQNACAVHYRSANEVWFSFPVDGSEYNNIIVVYDYVSKAWTKYEGNQISNLFLAKGSLPTKTPFFGGYTGSISYFGSSLLSDSGNAITCMIMTRPLAATGQTTERQYRRFYLNLDPVVGSTQAIDVNLIPNYGSSVAATRVMYENPFQSRVDFGISAKAIQAQIIHASASLPLTVFGYTFESRFQRAT